MKENDFENLKEMFSKINGVEEEMRIENKKFDKSVKIFDTLHLFWFLVVSSLPFLVFAGDVDIISWQNLNSIEYLIFLFSEVLAGLAPFALIGISEANSLKKYNNKLLKLSEEKKILCKEYEKYKSYLVQKEKSVDLDKNTENNIINKKQESVSFIETANLEDSHVKEKNGNAIKKRVLTKDNKRIK